MAIVGGVDEEELQKQGQAPAKTGGGESGYVGSAGGASATTKAAGDPTSSGGFTNLSNYLQANQNSGATTGQAAMNVVDQAGATAGAAQKGFEGSAGKDIDTATSGLGVNGATLANINHGGATVDSSVIGKIQGGIAKADQKNLDEIAAGGSGTSYTGPDSDSGYSTSYSGPAAAQAAAYAGPSKKAVHVAYGGPADTQHFAGDTAGKQTKAVGDNQKVYGFAEQANGGQSGVSALLKNAYQQPSYTAGENNLDAFLAGGTEGGRQALGRATGVAAGTEGGYGALNARLAGKIQGGRDKASATNRFYDASIGAAEGQTATVQKTYNDALTAAKGDTSASTAYADAIAAAHQQAMNHKADADAKAEAARVRAENAKRLIDGAGSGPYPGDAEGGRSTTGDAADMFQVPQKSKDNPYIPNPIPNPVPVVPPAPKPEQIRALLPLPSLNPAAPFAALRKRFKF